jgi:hypothetical protein
MTVYFARATGTDFVKIGYAAMVERRVAQLQAGCPHRLEIVRTVEGDFATEAAFHAIFAEHRTEGEWFRWSLRMATEPAPDPQSINHGVIDLCGIFGGLRSTASALGEHPSLIRKWLSKRIPHYREAQIRAAADQYDVTLDEKVMARLFPARSCEAA